MARVVWVTAALVCLSILPAHAQPGPTPPAPPPPHPPAPEVDGFEQRGGITLGLALGGGSNGVMFGAEVGGMVRHDLAIIGTATALVRGDDHGGSLGFLGLGARYWIRRFFADAELGRVTHAVSCDFEEQCGSNHFFAGLASVGFELAQTQHFGLELHASTLIAHDLSTVWFAGLGVHSYF